MRETWEFVNLYGRTRGVNRFKAVIATMDWLEQRPEITARGIEIPRLPSLRAWVAEETRLGNPALEAKVAETGDAELKKLLDWSLEVNAAIARMVHGVPPFPGVVESLEKAGEKADMIVVSQTPIEALEREWKEHGIDKYVRAIAGQEFGRKSEHIALAAGGKYPPDKILMVGDAYGDYKAAAENGALFYPILPGREEESWERFHEEALDKFFAGEYGGGYQDALMKELADALPEDPPWKR